MSQGSYNIDKAPTSIDPSNNGTIALPSSWVTQVNALIAAASVGSSIAYSSAIPFTYPLASMGSVTNTANITFTKVTTNAQINYGTVVRVLADGSHTVDYSAFIESTASNGYDNRSGIYNYFYFWYDGITYWVTIIQELGQTPVDIIPPAYSSSQVANANKNKILITYNENLNASIIPATTDFTVSGSKTVTNVAIASAIVTLTVNSNYAGGDTITFSYTPGTNKLQDAAGNTAIALVNQSVTNNIVVAVDLTFTVNTNLGQSGTTLTSTNNTNHALADYKLPASTDGWIDIVATDADALYGMIGFNTSQIDEGYAGWEYFVWFTFSGSNKIFYNAGAGVLDSGIAWTTGTHIRVARVSGVIKIQYSNDGITYTDIDTGPTDNSVLYINAEVLTDIKNIYIPRGFNVVHT